MTRTTDSVWRLGPQAAPGAAATLIVLAAGGCAAGGGGSPEEASSTAGAAGQGGTGAGLGGSGGALLDAGLGDAGAGGDPGGDAACAFATAEAQVAPVDIVFVVDQSGSMGEEIAQVVANIDGNFASILGASGLDYRLILIAAGSGSKPVCVQPPLGGPTCGAANPPRFFQVNQHIESTDSLYWLIETYASTNPVLRWDAQLRATSQKVMVVVSDDDASAFNLPPLLYGLDANQFLQKLFALDPPGVFGLPGFPRFVFHSIVGVDQPYDPAAPVTSAGQACPTAVNSGTQYQFLSVNSGGLRHPVCDPDYSVVFDRIANDVVARLACEFTLESTDAGTVDPTRVNVIFEPGSGPPEDIYRDDSAPCGAGADGWQFAPGGYETIVLCGQSCADVQADPQGKIQIALGCETKTRPPR